MRARLITGSALFLVAAAVAIGVYAGWWSFSGTVGPLRLNHFLGIMGGAYILVSLPVFRLARRRSHSTFAGGVFGNLVAFVLISMHFAQQTARSPMPLLGTGLAAYVLVVALVVAGFMQWSLPASRPRAWRLVYGGAALALYVVVGVHALRNFGIL